jgi:acyl-coenzyme A synthetase/AMP-(fatty) acid ligase
MQSPLPLRGQLRPDDLAVIVSSGGTTGVPKCRRRSFATYSAMVGAANDKHRRQLVNRPLAYLSQVLVDTTLIGGGTVVLKQRYDPAETLATIESERITDMLLVEPQLFETMNHPDVGRRNLSSLRSIVHVGGSAPAVLQQRAAARLGSVLTHAYGASETGLVSVLPPSSYEDPDRLTCAGQIYFYHRARLLVADRHEGFFGRLKTELFYPRDWRATTVDQFIEVLDSYIRWYNATRIKVSLTSLSPPRIPGESWNGVNQSKILAAPPRRLSPWTWMTGSRTDQNAHQNIRCSSSGRPSCSTRAFISLQ